VIKKVLYNANPSTRSFLSVENNSTSFVNIIFLLGLVEYSVGQIPFM
jgi:hypothetical protein